MNKNILNLIIFLVYIIVVTVCAIFVSPLAVILLIFTPFPKFEQCNKEGKCIDIETR